MGYSTIVINGRDILRLWYTWCHLYTQWQNGYLRYGHDSISGCYDPQGAEMV